MPRKNRLDLLKEEGDMSGWLRLKLKEEEVDDSGEIPEDYHSYNRSRKPESTKLLIVSQNDRREVPRLSKRRGKKRRDLTTTPAPPNRSTSCTLTDDEKLKRNMRAWGVDPKKGKRHKNFWFGKLVAMKNREKEDLDIQPVMLSDDFDEAVLTILNQEIQFVRGQTIVYEVVDQLNDEKVVGQPYYFNVNSQRYELRKEFQSFPPNVLDPFVRFPALQKIQRDSTDKIANRSLIFRALVGQHACHGTPCVSCGSDSNLRWNLSTKDYPHWSRLVCMSCESVYAIETAASSTSLEKKLLKGQVNGCGFFDHFHYIQKKNSAHSGAKQYIAMVSLESREGPAPVFVAEVTNVEPQLKPISFAQRERHLIFSKTILGNGYQSWFNIPSVPRDIQFMKQLALSITADEESDCRMDGDKLDSSIPNQSEQSSFRHFTLEEPQTRLSKIRKKQKRKVKKQTV